MWKPKHRGPSRVPILDRLWRRTVIDDATECWLYAGSLDKNGYGRIRLPHPSRSYDWVHRVSAKLFLGYKSGNRRIQINHEDCCPNRNCWNPRHIYVGTQSENTWDSIRLGTHKSFGKEDKRMSQPLNEQDDEVTDMDEESKSQEELEKSDIDEEGDPEPDSEITEEE